MKLHVKLLLSILATLGVVYGVILVVQSTRLSQRIERLAAANLEHEEQSEWRAIQNLQRACNSALNSAMVAGEMDVFRVLLAEQTKVEGLQELTVFNKDGIAAESTLPEMRKARLPQAVVERIKKDVTPWQERTDESFVLYQPMPVTPACIECHPRYDQVASGGVYRYRFSTGELKQAQTQWTAFSSELSRSSWLSGLWSGSILLLTAGAVILWLVRRQIARPLNQVSAALELSATRLADTAQSINKASMSLAEGSQMQAAALEQTSASVEETTSMAQRTADDAAQTNAAAAATRQAVETASVAMREMDQRMHGIQAATADVAKILKTIDEIAFQTNLLALNAAVEAARAGEAGAGFAVVADEVRSLAQRSAAAARNTADLTGQVTGQVREGSAISEQVAAHLRDIIAKIEIEEALVKQIAHASQEQGQGLKQINDAVTSIDQVTQRNAGMSEETASAAKELFQHSSELSEDVHHLLRLLHGRQPATAQRAAGPGGSGPTCRAPADTALASVNAP